MVITLASTWMHRARTGQPSRKPVSYFHNGSCLQWPIEMFHHHPKASLHRLQLGPALHPLRLLRTFNQPTIFPFKWRSSQKVFREKGLVELRMSQPGNNEQHLLNITFDGYVLTVPVGNNQNGRSRHHCLRSLLLNVWIYAILIGSPSVYRTVFGLFALHSRSHLHIPFHHNHNRLSVFGLKRLNIASHSTKLEIIFN